LGIAFANHHPAAIVECDLPTLVDATRAHIDDAGLAVAVFLEADHRRIGGERISWIDRMTKAAGRVAEVGDGVERNIRHRAAKDHVERQQIVHRRPRETQAVREGVGRIGGKARTGERGV
jgi:hypothetical protein